MILHGALMRDAAHHLQMVQGELPRDTGPLLEVALTRSAATYMKVHIGSTITLLGTATTMTSDSESSGTYAQTPTLRVVGIFQTNPDDSYWHSQTFQEPVPLPKQVPAPFTVLTSSTSLLHWIDTRAQRYQTRGISFAPSSTCFLTYTLVPARLDSAHLNELLNRLSQFQTDVARIKSPGSSSFNPVIAFPYITSARIAGAALHDPFGPELLETFQNELLLGQATTLILSIQIIGLILFFISMLAQAQVERQMPALVMLRSRGASGLQILATLFLQSFILCLLAGLLAPLLALEMVRLIAPLLLPVLAQDALNVLPMTFHALVGTIGFYALTAMLVVPGTQLLAFITALRGTILTLRHEAAR